MRILLVNKYLHVTGGADRHCLSLAKALRARGHDVRFLALEPVEETDEQGAFIPCLVSHHSRDQLSMRRRLSVFAEAFWNPHAARAVRSLLSSFEPEVIHAHKLHPQMSAAPVALGRRQAPIVQTLHDYEFMAASPFDDSGSVVDGQASRLSYRLLNSLGYPVRRLAHARLVDRFVAVSSFVAKVYAEKGIDSAVIPNFVDLPGGSTPGFDRRNGALFAGRLSRSKGVNDTIELARRLPDMPIAIAGDGPLRSMVEAEAARVPNLSYLGSVGSDELEERMRSVRVVVMPSQWSEPAGLVALEAMAVGTPVVAYDRGGLTDYVCDAGGGRVISSDIELLARACSQLHADEELWNRLSSAGVAGTRRTHSADTYVRRLEGVYADARSDFEIRSRRRVDPLTPVSAA